MLWWEFLMLLCGAWLTCVMGIAYFNGGAQGLGFRV